MASKDRGRDEPRASTIPKLLSRPSSPIVHSRSSSPFPGSKPHRSDADLLQEPRHDRRREALMQTAELARQYADQLEALQKTSQQLAECYVEFSRGDAHLAVLADQFKIVQKDITIKAHSLASTMTTRLANECTIYARRFPAGNPRTASLFLEESYLFFDEPFLKMLREMHSFHSGSAASLYALYSPILKGRLHSSFQRVPDEVLGSLAAVLEDPVATHYFRAFARHKHCLQNVDFIIEVADLLSDEDDGSFRRRAQAVFAEYVGGGAGGGAEGGVNIDAHLRAELGAQAEAPTRELYRSAREFVYGLVRTDTFPKFARSKHALKFAAHWHQRSRPAPASLDQSSAESGFVAGEGAIGVPGGSPLTAGTGGVGGQPWAFASPGRELRVDVLSGVLHRSLLPSLEGARERLHRRLPTAPLKDLTSARIALKACREDLEACGVAWPTSHAEPTSPPRALRAGRGGGDPALLRLARRECRDTSQILALALRTLRIQLQTFALAPATLPQLAGALQRMLPRLDSAVRGGPTAAVAVVLPTSPPASPDETLRLLRSHVAALEAHVSGPGCTPASLIAIGRTCRLARRALRRLSPPSLESALVRAVRGSGGGGGKGKAEHAGGAGLSGLDPTLLKSVCAFLAFLRTDVSCRQNAGEEVVTTEVKGDRGGFDKEDTGSLSFHRLQVVERCIAAAASSLAG